MDKPPQQSKRLESMLQKWGAQEALQEARRLHLRLPQRPSWQATLTRVRWWVLLATIVLLVVLAWAWVAASSHWHRTNAPKPAPPTQPAASPGPMEAVPMAGEGDAAAAATSPTTQAYGSAAEEAAALRQDLKRSQEALADAQRRLRSLNQEYQQLRQRFEQAQAAHEQAKAELGAARAQQSVMYGDLQRAVLGAARDGADDGDFSWLARQNAARMLRLLDQTAAARASCRQATTRLVVDRVEAVLTALALMEADKADSVALMWRLLDDGRLLGQVDKVLDGRDESAVVRAWLVKVKMILGGA